MPESERVSQRLDFIAWFSAYAGVELQSLGDSAGKVRPSDECLHGKHVRGNLSVLGNINADPDERWKLFSSYWPYVRTTGTGRTVLRVAWDLFGVEDIDQRTWKDISALLWQASEEGFYHNLLCQRANISMTFVDNVADPGTRSCCAPIRNYDHILAMCNRADVDELAHRFDESGTTEPCRTLEQLDGLLAKSVQRDVEEGCVSFKLSALPDIAAPSLEEVEWAFGRVYMRTRSPCDDAKRTRSPKEIEPALCTYLGHRFLTHIAQSGRPVQIHIADNATVERLNVLADQYPRVRFVGVYDGRVEAFSLLTLARARPNVSLAMGDLWRIAPRLARQSLMIWIQGVPLCKLFAFSGNTTIVEAVCAQAWIAREQIATMFSEMVADGVLDEEDALLAMKRMLYETAREYFSSANMFAPC